MWLSELQRIVNMDRIPNIKYIRYYDGMPYWTTLNFEIPAALIYQSEIYYKVDRLLTGLTAQQIGTTGLLVLLLSNLY